MNNPLAPRDLVTAVTRFCRALRERGMAVTPAEAADAARTLALVDLGDRQELYLALRSVLAARVEDYPVFDDVFVATWDAAAPPRPGESGVIPAPTVRRSAPARRESRGAPSLDQWLKQGAAAESDETVALKRASPQAGGGARDFSTFGDEELADITRLARQLARRLAARPSRRWRPAARGARLHLRRTVRRSLALGGDAAELVYRERKPRKTKLVVLCDVSGSMDLYSRFLLQFLYALQNAFARVETFVFGTRLSRVTDHLRGAAYRAALRTLADGVQDWSGGTRIGECLTAFLHDWPRLVDRRTVVIVLSDGWDTGDPAVLGDALRVLAERAGRLIWLNPLLGSPGYQPLTGGMQAALPHLDVFAPAHSVDSLRALARHLVL